MIQLHWATPETEEKGQPAGMVGRTQQSQIHTPLRPQEEYNRSFQILGGPTNQVVWIALTAKLRSFGASDNPWLNAFLICQIILQHMKYMNGSKNACIMLRKKWHVIYQCTIDHVHISDLHLGKFWKDKSWSFIFIAQFPLYYSWSWSEWKSLRKMTGHSMYVYLSAWCRPKCT